MRKGQKLICKKKITNKVGIPIFEEGKIYEVIYVDNEGTDIQVCLNHILHGNEYVTFPLVWVIKNFKIV
jgi:hypothetical protein